jgi:thioredoxin-like negative regulator of GroEL
MIRLTLYGRRDCHLCHEMRAVVEAVVGERPGAVVIEEVDVDDDPALAARVGADVPVLLVNGREAFRHRLTADALRARLAAER